MIFLRSYKMQRFIVSNSDGIITQRYDINGIEARFSPYALPRSISTFFLRINLIDFYLETRYHNHAPVCERIRRDRFIFTLATSDLWHTVNS